MLIINGSLGEPDACLDETVMAVNNEDLELGHALLNGGYSLVDRLEDYESNLQGWYNRKAPGIARVIDDSRLLKLFPKLTRNVLSGELWESTEHRLYRFWQIERTLQNETSIDFTHGWTNKSEIVDSFTETDRCHGLTGRYAMVKPIIDPTTLQFLTHISGVKHPVATIFAGCNGTATTLHFDRSTNYFFQLRGLKRFILLPPSAVTGLYVAPAGHPYNRQSQIEPAVLSTPVIDYNKYPLAKQFQGRAIVADMNPGDVLLIPTYWSHFVVTKSNDSVGLALRMPLDHRIQDALKTLAIPLELSWSHSTKIKMMNAFLRELLPEIEAREVFKKRWEYAFPHYRSSSSSSDRIETDDDNIKSLSEYAKRGKELAGKVRKTLSNAYPNEDKVEMLLKVEYADDVVITLFRPHEAVEFVLREFA